MDICLRIIDEETIAVPHSGVEREMMEELFDGSCGGGGRS